MGVSSTFGSPLLTACLGGRQRRAAPRRPVGLAWLGSAWLADACKQSAVVHPARLVLSVGQRSYNAHLPLCNAHLPLCNAHLPAAQASLAWPAGLGLSTLVAAASSADHSVDTQPNAEIVLSYVCLFVCERASRCHQRVTSYMRLAPYKGTSSLGSRFARL